MSREDFYDYLNEEGTYVEDPDMPLYSLECDQVHNVGGLMGIDSKFASMMAILSVIIYSMAFWANYRNSTIRIDFWKNLWIFWKFQT